MEPADDAGSAPAWFERAPVGLVITQHADNHIDVLAANRAMLAIFGGDLRDARRRFPSDLAPLDDEVALGELDALIAGRSQIRTLIRLATRVDGTAVWVRATSRLLSHTAGGVRLISSVEDVTDVYQALFSAQARLAEVERADEESHQAERIMAVAFDHAPLGIAVIGVLGPDRGRFLQVNNALAVLTRRLDLVGRHYSEVMLPNNRTSGPDEFARLVAGEIDRYDSVRLMRRAQAPFHAQLTASLVRDKAGDPTLIVMQIQDATPRVTHEQWLARRASRDELTGLVNRWGLRERLSSLLSQMDPEAPPLAVLMFDLDRFKAVNDHFGHEAGDRLLMDVGSSLELTAPEQATVARLGGDEFVVLVPDIRELDLPELAAALRSSVDLAVAEQPFACDVTASVGWAVTNDPDTSIEDLLRRADEAMYDDKRASRRG